MASFHASLDITSPWPAFMRLMRQDRLVQLGWAPPPPGRRGRPAVPASAAACAIPAGVAAVHACARAHAYVHALVHAHAIHTAGRATLRDATALPFCTFTPHAWRRHTHSAYSQRTLGVLFTPRRHDQQRGGGGASTRGGPGEKVLDAR